MAVGSPGMATAGRQRPPEVRHGPILRKRFAGAQKHQCQCAHASVRPCHPRALGRGDGWVAQRAGWAVPWQRGEGGRGSAAAPCSELHPERQASAV